MRVFVSNETLSDFKTTEDLAFPVPEGFREVPVDDSARGAQPIELAFDGKRIVHRDSVEDWYLTPDGQWRAFRGDKSWQKHKGATYRTPVAFDPVSRTWSLLGVRGELRQYASTIRRRKETETQTFEGVPVRLDDRGSRLLQSALIHATTFADEPIEWDAGGDRIETLTAKQVIAINEQASAYIQGVFKTYAAVVRAINAHKITDKAGVDRAFE